jgi:transcriptional regulator with XRE-family HTH domain
MTEVPQTTRAPQWTLGDRMRKAREHAGLKQTELALATGISRASITNYETGKSTPSRPVLLSWAMATAVPVSWLRDGTEDYSPDPGPGTSAQFRGGRVNVPKNLNPWDSWGSPTPLTLAVAA